MRTTSANIFTHFLQGLDIELELNKQWAREEASQHANVDEAEWTTPPSNSPTIQAVGKDQYCNNSRTTPPDNSSSETPDVNSRDVGNIVPITGRITVSEGDLLQPERIQNGIVFNVVKKEELTLAQSCSDSEPQHVSSGSAIAESVQLEGLGKEMENFDMSSESDSRDDDETTSNFASIDGSPVAGS